MFKQLLIVGALVSFGTAAHSAVTLQFSQGGKGATGFSNAAGTPTNGMRWGIVIDTSGNGFGDGTYDSITLGSNGFVNANGSATDDYFVDTGLLTQSIGAPFFAGVEAGAGAITTTNTVPDPGTVTGLTAGDAFGIIWFDSNSGADGAKYGFFTSASFQMPGAGAVTSFSDAFAGADPSRSASLTFGAVPEPSRIVLLGLAGLGLMIRRRR